MPCPLPSPGQEGREADASRLTNYILRTATQLPPKTVSCQAGGQCGPQGPLSSFGAGWGDYLPAGRKRVPDSSLQSLPGHTPHDSRTWWQLQCVPQGAGTALPGLGHIGEDRQGRSSMEPTSCGGERLPSQQRCHLLPEVVFLAGAVRLYQEHRVRAGRRG